MHECTCLCAHTHTHTHTHTYTHTLTQTGLVPLGETLGSYISHCIHKACKHVQEHTCTLLCKYHIHHKHTHTHTHTCAHTHAHAHTQTGLVTLAVTLGSYFSHCLYKAYMCMNVYTCAHTHACAHTHTDWACTTCSDFGFLFLTLSLQSVHVHECTHLCTHTCTHTCTYTHRLGLYHLQSFYKAYMCMNEHTYTHVHTHTVPRSEFVLLFLTLSRFSQSTYICMNVHT